MMHHPPVFIPVKDVVLFVELFLYNNLKHLTTVFILYTFVIILERCVVENIYRAHTHMGVLVYNVEIVALECCNSISSFLRSSPHSVFFVKTYQKNGIFISAENI